jgi:hypothetical protein
MLNLLRIKFSAICLVMLSAISARAQMAYRTSAPPFSHEERYLPSIRSSADRMSSSAPNTGGLQPAATPYGRGPYRLAAINKNRPAEQGGQRFLLQGLFTSSVWFSRRLERCLLRNRTFGFSGLWISFVADTKMIKAPAFTESFRRGCQTARRRAFLPDERLIQLPHPPFANPFFQLRSFYPF